MSLLELPNGNYVDPAAVVAIYVTGNKGFDGREALHLSNGQTLTARSTRYTHEAFPIRDAIAALINDALPQRRRVPPSPPSPPRLSLTPEAYVSGDRVTHYYGDDCPGGHGSPLDDLGGRVLTAKQMHGPWQEYSTGELVDRHGDYWTVVDRDTGEHVGSFGLPVQMATRDEALDEASRFGSKWDWTVDRSEPSDNTAPVTAE